MRLPLLGHELQVCEEWRLFHVAFLETTTRIVVCRLFFVEDPTSGALNTLCLSLVSLSLLREGFRSLIQFRL